MPAKACDYLIRVGFKPGVTDNVSRTFRTAAADILGRKLADDEYVFSSTEYLVSGKISKADAENIGFRSGQIRRNSVYYEGYTGRRNHPAGIQGNVQRILQYSWNKAGVTYGLGKNSSDN